MENNPVRAKIVDKPWDYIWSSARKHVNIAEDSLVRECPIAQLVGDWKEYLMKEEIEDILNEIRNRKRNLSGLPLGERDLVPKPVGRPKK